MENIEYFFIITSIIGIAIYFKLDSINFKHH